MKKLLRSRADKSANIFTRQASANLYMAGCVGLFVCQQTEKEVTTNKA